LIVVLTLLLVACSPPGTTTTAPDGIQLIGDWVLEEATVGGQVIPEGDYRITLLIEDGNAGGVAACNSYGGSYTSDDDGFIRFGTMSQTEMACAEPAMTAEQLYLETLLAVDSYALEPGRLTLTGPDLELVFSPIPPIDTAPLLDQRWVLESLIEGEAVSSVQGDGFLLLSSDGNLTGSTGCRRLTGVFTVVADEIIPTDLAAEGGCEGELQRQDSHVVSVIENGFIATVEEDRLTVMDPDGIGLQYRAAS
jgi:heat shock protein HslJ